MPQNNWMQQQQQPSAATPSAATGGEGMDWLEPSQQGGSPATTTNPELTDILNSTLGYWLQQE